MQNPSSDRSDPAAVARPRSNRAEETIKETFESIIIAFILAFVFRAYVVEAFVIPTGSMAPTLLGEHVAVSCPQCGYHFTSDVPDAARQQVSEVTRGGERFRSTSQRPHLTHALNLVCPMCHFPVPLLEGTRMRPGDRILVHKYIYSVLEPRRWDVVVFKNPLEPNTNFIKRLVGLPGEQLWVIEGNIYTRPLTAGADDWRIARKLDRPEVQRAVWQPIYHSQFVPLDGGGKSLDRRGATIDHLWRQPWTPAEPDAWRIDRQAFDYAGQGSGRLRFNFDAALVGRDGLYPYNQLSLLVQDLDPIEDVRVSALIEPRGPGLIASLSTTARLDRDAVQATRLPLTARIDAAGKAQLLSVNPDGSPRVLAEGQVPPWQIGRPRRLELWFADQQADLWLDGRRVLSWAFDLSLATIRDRPALPGVLEDAPDVTIELTGAPASVREAQLDRDLYYSSVEPRYFTLGQGTLDKQSALHRGSPVTIELDRFFCMGDNSPSSSDGRFWTGVNPWIRQRMLDNDPRQLGVVPRDLMMGKAFFVYYPAPHAWRPDLPGLFPNFGDMRFIH